MINVAVLWLVDENGELLLARRADHKPQDPGVWGPTVTGKMDPGESFEQTLLREVFEETGLRPPSYAPVFLLQADYVHPDSEQRVFSIYYAVVNRSVEHAIRLDTNEVADVQWLSFKQVESMLATKQDNLVPSAHTVWPETFKMLQSRLDIRS